MTPAFRRVRFRRRASACWRSRWLWRPTPRLLLLDEVAAGLTESEADHVAGLIRGIQRELGVAVIWIEHAVGTLMRAVDRMMVLDYGELIADGAPAAVAADRRVIDAYLGGSTAGRRGRR